MIYDYSTITEYLLDWFELNARILRWREAKNPYYTWVSEIMLQQTRVEAVKTYFDRFVDTLPTIKELAEVDEEKLIKLWEGLGYYNRVRNMQKAARIIVDEYNGNLPSDHQLLLKLPGIGSYTAGAIASIAFGIPVAAVDGNVLRVTKRIAGSYDDISTPTVKKQLEHDLTEIIPKNKPGDFNQALMELGALICLPNGKPLCDKCPVMHLCRAFHEDTINQIPVKQTKKQRKSEDKTILVLKWNGQYGLRKRPMNGLLPGLWELPSLEGKWTVEAITDYLNDQSLKYNLLQPLIEAKHIFSHVEWHMTGFLVDLKEPPIGIDVEWVTKERIQKEYALPSAFRVYGKYFQ